MYAPSQSPKPEHLIRLSLSAHGDGEGGGGGGGGRVGWYYPGRDLAVSFHKKCSEMR